MESDRYEGKPFLRLLELYVLWSIDALDVKQESSLNQLTPKLQKTYSSKGKWHEIVSAQMDLPSDLPTKIRSLWKKNKHNLDSQGITAEPEVFAQQFVDNNFFSKEVRST
jgi:hypothetical protein